MQTQYRSSGQVTGQILTPANVTALATRNITAVAGQPQTQAQAEALVSIAAAISTLPDFGGAEFQRQQYQKQRVGHIVAGVAAGTGLAIGILSAIL